MLKPKATIACPKCMTIKLVEYKVTSPVLQEEKFEGCSACGISARLKEWEIVQIIVG